MKRAAAVLALALLLLGAVLSIQAANTPRYTDETAFRAALQALHASHLKEFSSLSKSISPAVESSAFHQGMRKIDAAHGEQYWNLLNTFRTNKFLLEDYGRTALVFGLVLLLAGPLARWAMRTPPRRWQLLLLMFVPPLLNLGALLFDQSQMMAREDSSPWDEWGPLMIMGMLFFFFFPMIWMGLHILLVPKVYYRSQPLSLAWSRWINPWLGLLALLAAISMAWAGWHGQWWWLLAFLAWTYAYLCMAVTRRAHYLFADRETEWPPAWNKS